MHQAGLCHLIGLLYEDVTILPADDTHLMIPSADVSPTVVFDGGVLFLVKAVRPSFFQSDWYSSFINLLILYDINVKCS